MGLFIKVIVLFFAILTIFRQIIEPFIEGLRGRKKPYNESNVAQKVRFNSSPNKKNIAHPDPKQIQDAEFEEIKEETK